MPRDDDRSLGGEHTFDGKIEHDESALSVGGQATFGDEDNGNDAPFDDGMEVVDLSARYTIEGTLGKGGMGEVLLATDTRLERKVAIKRILGDAAKSRTAVSRFLTEAKSIAALNHPNIVQIYDYGRAADGPFLIMEFVEGSSLLDRCREGVLPLDEAIDLTCQLCDGLGKAHDANIIHRDIKPANVLLTVDGTPKLTDFGLAKDETADTGLSVAGAVLGTLDFMPPEQRKDAALTDNRSDLWSLAATLYQMVTGEAPRVIDLDDVPRELRPVLSKALKSKPDARFQTIEDFREALASLQTADVEVTPRSAESQPASEPAELASGECPQCHAQNNLSRKFCHGCGESLRVQCLSCKADIPIWEKFCGECGGDQATLVEEKRRLQEEREAQQRLRQEEREAQQRLAEEISRIDEWTNSIGMTFRLIQPGTFTMGEGADSHQVTLTEPFHLGIYTVTQEQYRAVMGKNPSKFQGPQHPVEQVSWGDAVEFCRRLSALPAEKSAGCVYRLPTEAEWEYACRAGTKSRYSFGEDTSRLGQYAWFSLNSTHPKTGSFLDNLFSAAQKFHHPVGGKKPNPWGFYDMYGNVHEWCQDWYGKYPGGAMTDPTGPSSGSRRVLRGGAYCKNSGNCRSASRSWSAPGDRSDYLGFRVVRSSVIHESGSPSKDPTGIDAFQKDIVRTQGEQDGFEHLVPVVPHRKCTLEAGIHPISMRVVDLLTPIGKGQRALIVAPPRTGTTTLLRDIRSSLSKNHPEVRQMVLLVDERPEQVAEIRGNSDAEVFELSSSRDAESNVRLIETVVAQAKHLAVTGKDVYLELDSVTEMIHAISSQTENRSEQRNQESSHSIDATALNTAKRLFDIGRQFRDGGSITVCATVLVDRGRNLDQVVFEKFKGTGTMELVLSRELADRRICPAIDITRSGTRDEEKLFSAKELEAVIMLRRSLISLSPVEAMETLTRTLERFPTNAEFLSRVLAIL